MNWQKRTMLASTIVALMSTHAAAEIQQFSLDGNTLLLDTDSNDFTITVLNDNSFQVTFLTDNNGNRYHNLPSMALPEHTSTDASGVDTSQVELIENERSLTLKFNEITAHVDKNTHAISYAIDGNIVAKERNGLSISDTGCQPIVFPR